MIDRQGGQIIFCCDECDETYESGTHEFNEAWTIAKRDGWRAYKLGEDWMHECPGCNDG